MSTQAFLDKLYDDGYKWNQDKKEWYREIKVGGKDKRVWFSQKELDRLFVICLWAREYRQLGI